MQTHTSAIANVARQSQYFSLEIASFLAMTIIVMLVNLLFNPN